jgi:hypothetical protein
MAIRQAVPTHSDNRIPRAAPTVRDVVSSPAQCVEVAIVYLRQDGASNFVRRLHPDVRESLRDRTRIDSDEADGDCRGPSSTVNCREINAHMGHCTSAGQRVAACMSPGYMLQVMGNRGSGRYTQ